MAHIQFEPYPTVEPRPAPPEDYQRIGVPPQAFGEQVGAGLEKAGAGFSAAGKFYGQVAASDANNQLMEGATKILHGDRQTGIGPDGQPTINTGYLGTQKRAAMDQADSATKQLEDLRTQLRGNLSTAESQLEFDDFSRRYLSYVRNDIGQHADQQANAWYGDVEKSNYDNAISGIRQNPNDQTRVDSFTAMAMQSRLRTISRTVGNAKGPDVDAVVNNALTQSRADAAAAQIDALIPSNPAAAQKILESPSGALLKGPTYDALSAKLNGAVDKAQTDTIVNGIIAGGSRGSQAQGGGQNNPGNIRVPGSTEAFQSFPTPEAGIAAIHGNLIAYQRDHGINTLAGVISRWAPPNENDTPKLIQQAASRTGLAPNQQIDLGDPVIRDKVAQAIVQQEQGNGSRPTATASSPMQQPVPGFPTHEELIARIPAGLSDQQYDRVYAGVSRRYGQMVQSTSADRAQTLEQYKGGIAMLADGREFNIDEPKIRSLFPTDTANEMIGNLNDARTIGQQIESVRSMPLASILNQQAANRAILANSTGETYARQSRLSAAFDKAAEQHIKALGEDPAGYVAATNHEIQGAAMTMQQETPEAAAMLRGHGQPTAAEAYAGKMLGEQDRLGVPIDDQHVLDNHGAVSMAQQIMADPEQAPARMKSLATQWGSQWPKVWQDLSQLGKLPPAYQMVGALDNEGDGALLARALGSVSKEGVNRPLDDLLDKGAAGNTRPSQTIRTRVEGSEPVQDYSRSMLASGASAQQVQGIVSSIGLLGQAKALYHNQDPAAAADDAVQSAIGKWEFLPNGGARIPRANADAITDNAQRAVEGLSLAAVQSPAIYGQAQAPGSATAEDWLRLTQASPNWITVGNSIRLMDNAGRFVRRTGGGFVEVPFNVQAVAAAQQAAPPPPSPNMP